MGSTHRQKELIHSMDSTSTARALRTEIKNANEAVCSANDRLRSIRAQLGDHEKLSDSIQEGIHLEEEAALDIESRIATKKSEWEEMARQHQALCAEHDILGQQAVLARAGSKARVEEIEREYRNLKLDHSQSKSVHLLQTQASKDDEQHRSKTERKLRLELCSSAHAMNYSREKLEHRNAALARDAVRIDSERREAEKELQDLQVRLEKLVVVHTAAEEKHNHALEELAVQGHADQEALRVKTASLQCDVDDIRTEHNRCVQSVKRAEALNDGLRAQIAVLQRQAANTISLA